MGTKDGRNSNVTYKLKSFKNFNKTNIEDGEDLEELNSILEKLKLSDAALNDYKSRNCHYYLYKYETRKDKSGKECFAIVIISITNDGRLHCLIRGGDNTVNTYYNLIKK